MNPTFRKQPNPPTTTSSALTSTYNHSSSMNPDPIMAYTSSNSNSVNLSNSHPSPGFHSSSKSKNPLSSSPKVDSFGSCLSKSQPKAVEKVATKAKKPCNDNPQKFSKEFNTSKLYDSVERFERTINFISSQDEEMKETLQGHAYLSSRRQSVSLSSRSGRRRSIGGSQIELSGVFASNGVKVVSADMPPFMQIHAVRCARKAYDSMEKFTSKSLAFSLKKEFDGVYGPAWHCIVGKSFGSFVTHSVGGFLYFSMAQKLHILLFKTSVQRAD